MRKPAHILFMAQLPPPFHGQSLISGKVYDIFSNEADTKVTHLWKGGAKSATDVGKRSLSKYLEFASMVMILVGYLLRLKRFDVSYIGVAPWAHTIVRDAILMFISKLLAKRVWIHIHGEGLDKFLAPRSIKEKIVSLAFKNVELITLTNADYKKAEMSAHFSKVHLLPNFAFDPGAHKPRHRKTLHLGMVGNLDQRKGVFDFVETLRQLKSAGIRVKGSIIGGSTAQLSVEAMKAHVSDKGLEKEINVTGHVDGDDKNTLLKDIDIFLYPSRHDLSPLSLIEAIAHGCVPIVFATGGIPEIVGPNFTKNIMPLEMDRKTFAKAAADVVMDYSKFPKKLNEDSKLVRSQFLKTYSEAKFRSNILAMLAQVSNVNAHDAAISTVASKGSAS